MARDDGQMHAFAGQSFRTAAPETFAGTAYQRLFTANAEIHVAPQVFFFDNKYMPDNTSTVPVN